MFIPEKQPRHEQGATEQRHRFRLNGWRLEVVIRIVPSLLPVHRRTREPDAGVPYVLTVGTRRIEGETERGGIIRLSGLPPDADDGTLEILGRHLRLRFGELDPADEVTGEQARLNQLGYSVGRIDGEPDAKTAIAKDLCQALNEVPESDVAPVLKELHGD
jgi:hypothetical protein